MKQIETIEQLVKDCVSMLKNNFDKSQIREEIWRWNLRKHNNSIRLESIIFLSMEIYEQVLIEFNKND